MKNGSGPGPAPAVTSPISLASEQVPSAACGSAHNGTCARLPDNPGGVVTVIPPRSSSGSSRKNVTLKGLYPPAWLLVVPATNDGANRGPLQPVISNGGL